eukprot:4885027-Pyramimonas_sp.AAC.2
MKAECDELVESAKAAAEVRVGEAREAHAAEAAKALEERAQAVRAHRVAASKRLTLLFLALTH